jgi:hypothetical protein
MVMSESPLQKLLRLRKEKEQANANSPGSVGQGTSADSPSSNQPQETPALETVSGPSCSSEEPSGTEGLGVSSSEGGVVLSSEGVRSVGDTGISPTSSKSTSEPALVSQVTQATQSKPMSAMDRLRALKSGGSNVRSENVVANPPSNVPTSATVVPSTSKQVAEGSQRISGNESAPVIPSKPRKTHPIAMEMAELEESLNSHVPGFVSILSTIHKKLRADPDVVTLLDDDEIAVIVSGLEKHTNVTIVAPSAVKAAKAKARKEPVSAMDL